MARAETIANPAWRVQVFNAAGQIVQGFQSSDGIGHDARAYFQTVELIPGYRAEYQIRHPGKSRFLTWGRRP